MPISVDQLLTSAAKEIRASPAVDLWRARDARVNAEELLQHVLGREITAEALDGEVPAAARRRFERLLHRRLAGQPVALIVGTTAFRRMELKVASGVFIPRSSSELLAGEAIRRLRGRRGPVAVDVATGSGPVALAIAREVRGASVFGLDISPKALRLARENARRLVIERVRFLRSDMLSALPAAARGTIDVFTLHPPYVARSLVTTLPSEIRDYEPEESLTDQSDDGLGLARRLAVEAHGWLRRGGWVLIEVSPDLARSVGALLRRSGYRDVRSRRDSLGATRVVGGRL